MAKRFDKRKIDRKLVVKTPQGFLLIPAFTARTGVQKYRLADGSILTEMRPEEEVFSEASMGSLRTAVVTDGHPPQMINPDNVDKFMVGFTNGVVTKETVSDSKEKFLGTHLIITHRDAIEAINAGKAELSNGYNVDLEFTKGTHDGENFDAIQRNIVNNHIAIVWKGRAGKHASLKLDEDDAILLEGSEMINKFDAKELGARLRRLMEERGITVEQMASAAGIDASTVGQILAGSILAPPIQRIEAFARLLNVSVESLEKITPETRKNIKDYNGGIVVKITVNGKEYDVSDDLGSAVKADQKSSNDKYESEKKRADDAVADSKKTDSDAVTSLKKENTELKDDKVKLGAKNDCLEEDLKKSKSGKSDSVTVGEAVKARLSVMSVGKKMLDAETLKKIDEMSDNDIKKAVIKVGSPSADDEKLKNDSYVDARFDHIKENLVDTEGVKTKIGEKIVSNREDGKDDKYESPDERRAASIEQSKKDSTETTVGRRIDKK